MKIDVLSVGLRAKNFILVSVLFLFRLWTHVPQVILFKELVTHHDILKIYRIIQYSKNIFKCNMVKNILKIYKKIIYLLKKIICV